MLHRVCIDAVYSLLNYILVRYAVVLYVRILFRCCLVIAVDNVLHVAFLDCVALRFDVISRVAICYNEAVGLRLI